VASGGCVDTLFWISPERPMFDPLGALEHFSDCPGPDTAKINGCRCRVYGICAAAFVEFHPR